MKRLCLLTLSAVAFVPGILVPALPATGQSQAIFVPEIGYTYAGRNYTDLRLANRAGTAAILVNRSNLVTVFDLGPRDSRRIVYSQDKALDMRTWAVAANGVVSVSVPTRLYTGPDRIEAVDVSPDGTRVAFATIGIPQRVHVLDISNPAGRTELLSGWFVTDVRWSPDGTRLYVNGRPPGGTLTSRQIFVLNPDGSGLVPFAPVGSGVVDFDVTRPSLDTNAFRLIINHRPYNSASPMMLHTYDSLGSLQVIGQGDFAHYSCNNSQIIYRGYASTRPPTMIANADGSNPVIWSRDHNIRLTDWMPGCAT